MIPNLSPIAWAAVILGSALLALACGYCVFAPWLSRVNGDRFTNESGPLADTEAKAWKTYRETGEFPGVDEKTLKRPGWENALMAEAGKKALQ